MAQEWYGDRDESDVVVSLVRSPTAFTRETRTISSYQGSTAADGEGGRNTLGSKRKRDTELEKDTVQEDALRKYFASALGEGTEDVRTRFDAVFHKLIEGPCCSGILQGFLKHVNDEVEKAICDAIEDAKDQRRERFRGYYCTHYIDNIRWVLRFLLETGCAKDLVELIVEGPKLSDCLKSLSEIEGSGYSSAIFEWIVVIQRIFEKVIAGHLLLKASTRYLLFRRWSWILKYGCTPKGYDRQKEIEEIVSKFIVTFPLDKQKKLISNWGDFYWEDNYGYNWPIQESWVANLQRSLVSLEAQQAHQSTAQRAGEYTGQSSATPSESSSVPASPSISA